MSAAAKKSKIKKGKPMSNVGQTKEIITRIIKWMGDNNTKPHININKQVADILEISERSIYKILREESTEGSKKPRARKTQNSDDEAFFEEVIRNTIYQFNIEEKTPPTLDNLLPVLQEKVNIKGKGKAGTILKKLGFQKCKAPENKKVYKEKLEVINKRASYLNQVAKYRTQRRPIVYTDETYIYSPNVSSLEWSDNKEKGSAKSHSKARFVIVHASTENGFIPGAFLIFELGAKTGDYCYDLDFKNYHKWCSSLLIPNLERNSVVVIENESYHNRISESVPNPNSPKQEMKNWLKKYSIPFEEDYLKAELFDLVLKNKPQNQPYEIDYLFEQHGHTVLRLPLHHPELNCNKKFGALILNYIASHKADFALEKVKHLVIDKINSMNHEWKNIYEHVKQCEEEYRKKDIIMDNLYENEVTMLNNSSSSEIEISSDEE